MARSSILDFRILIVPGLHGSGPDHWQSRWQRLYPYFERIEQAQWDVPDLAGEGAAQAAARANRLSDRGPQPAVERARDLRR